MQKAPNLYNGQKKPLPPPPPPLRIKKDVIFIKVASISEEEEQVIPTRMLRDAAAIAALKGDR